MASTINIDSFKNISQRGYMAYGIMCAENYILTHRANEDWRPIFSILWPFTSEQMWEEWRLKVIDILPECFSEFPDYNSSDFSVLQREEYEAISLLYKKMPEKWEQIIEALFEMENYYAYGAFSDEGIECSKSLMEIVNILSEENIELPDIKQVEFSSFNEESGRGKPFDGSAFSKILSSSENANDKARE